MKLLQYISGYVPENSAVAIGQCGTWLQMVADHVLVNKKLYRANFCKNRFCPMCAWRRAAKDGVRIAALMEYIRQEYGKEFVLLTLTAPNVQGKKLNEEIKRFNGCFKNLMKREEVLQVVKGYVRKLEVTHNEERDDYHPHFHVLLAVNSSYFVSRDYIKRGRWLELWQEAMDDETITMVDVRKFRGGDVREIAKYAAKDSDYLSSQKVFGEFYVALKGRQLATYAGLFAEANKLYKQRCLEYLKEQDHTEYYYMLMYRWLGSRYDMAEVHKLTDKEKLKAVMGLVIDGDDDN